MSNDRSGPAANTGDAMPATRGCSAAIVWDEAYLAYDLGGGHVMHPVRWALTMSLAERLGALDALTTQRPVPATDEMLCQVHDLDYIAAVREASTDPAFVGWGLGTPDNPVFAAMHESAALIAGGSIHAAEMVATGEVAHAINIAGGLHHAMRRRASGFCVYNDAALAVSTLLRNGARRVAYLDVDVHHGDGVQAAFYDNPNVLTISVHESPQTLFPWVSGYPQEIGNADAMGTSVNIALPAGTPDEGWLRAFHAVVPGLLRAFRPDALVLQCGCDSHREDPLADLRLSVDGQRASYLAAHQWAHEFCGGRLVALGGGGYGLLRVVPRAWTHLLGIVGGAPVEPDRPIPESWRAVASGQGLRVEPPTVMTDGAAPTWDPWQPGGESDLDRAVASTRSAVFPLHGLDPDDPRD
jgi:acetoin utilization protein AcuC